MEPPLLGRPLNPGLGSPAQGTHLPEEGLLVDQLGLQLVADVVQRGGLPLSAEVALLQGDDALLHVLLLTHGLEHILRYRGDVGKHATTRVRLHADM